MLPADHGFDVSESVGAMHTYTRGKSQLSTLEVEEASKIYLVIIPWHIISTI